MSRALLLAAALGLLGACAGARPRPAAPPSVGRIVVLPVDNASGRSVPVRALLGAVEQALRARGLEVVAGDPVERFLAAHRMRFTGAVPADAAGAAARELGADALLVTSLEEYVALGLPRVAFGMRLVSAEPRPRILWSDSVALAGDDAPGFLARGLVRTMGTLQRRALARLADDLGDWISTGRTRPACVADGRFGPSVRFRSDVLDGERRTVAVLPFLNETRRRRAGDVVTNAFVRGLAATGRFEVVEPGLVRESLLAQRVVMEGGVSLDTARVVLDSLDADLVLAGYVRELREDVASAVPPRVDFTALLIDRRTEEVVWEVSSYHQGDEGVRWFDLGRVRSSSELACRMVARASDLAARGPSTRSASSPAPRRAASAGSEAAAPEGR